MGSGNRNPSDNLNGAKPSPAAFERVVFGLRDTLLGPRAPQTPQTRPG
jgi:hypothetical protein